MILAVFLSSRAWKPLVLKVGQRGERFIDEIDVEDDGTLGPEHLGIRGGRPDLLPER